MFTSLLKQAYRGTFASMLMLPFFSLFVLLLIFFFILAAHLGSFVLMLPANGAVWGSRKCI